MGHQEGLDGTPSRMINESANASTEPRGSYRPFKWTLFLGLSRTPHGILDVATPAMAALLWLGHFPSPAVVVVGIITAFAGYTAVYALNDLVDYGIDKERLALRQDTVELFDVDALMVRYPLAQGALPIYSGLIWCIIWALIALAGAWWLNPVCAAIFVVSALMEMLYCKLLRVTHLKIIPSAIVKASGRHCRSVRGGSSSPARVRVAPVLMARGVGNRRPKHSQ